MTPLSACCSGTSRPSKTDMQSAQRYIIIITHTLVSPAIGSPCVAGAMDTQPLATVAYVYSLHFNNTCVIGFYQMLRAQPTYKDINVLAELLGFEGLQCVYIPEAEIKAPSPCIKKYVHKNHHYHH